MCSGAAAGARADGRHLHEPAPRADQRADRARRRADLRRRSRRVLGRLAELERFVSRRSACPRPGSSSSRLRPSRWFADMAVDAAVIEVGLGGRYDATNVADADVAVVTNVELDHTDILGATRESIAAREGRHHQAGRARRRSASTSPTIASIFEDEARRVGAGRSGGAGVEFGCDVQPARPRWPGGRPADAARRFSEDVSCRFTVRTRRDNAAVRARRGARPSSETPLEQDRRAASLRRASRCRGASRWSRRHPLVVLDGAHNAAGAAAARRALEEDFAAARRGRRRHGLPAWP